MNAEERQYIIGRLAEGLSEDDVATGLPIRRARADVRKVAEDMAASAAQAAYAADLRWTELRGPLVGSKYEKIGVASDGKDIVRPRQRPLNRVNIRDLAEFCKAFELQPDRLMEVVYGEREEHKGFSQGRVYALGGEVTRAYRPPNDTATGAAARKKRDTAKEPSQHVQYAVQPETIHWHPVKTLPSPDVIYTPRDN
jgi:hypothetical protein